MMLGSECGRSERAASFGGRNVSVLAWDSESFEWKRDRDVWGCTYENVRTFMATIIRSPITALFLFALLSVAPASARANLFLLAASGTISENSSGDSTIP